MTEKAWKEFAALREKYRAFVEELGRRVPGLGRLQQELVEKRSGPAYRVETPVVFNRDLDDAGLDRDFRLILAADNPGRREQAQENRRYLVGPSGKIAQGFFRRHEEMGIDFRQNVLILNKTPIHTPRTSELAVLRRMGGPELAEALDASQRFMAELLVEFHRVLAPVPVWIIGYSEMKKGGVFEIYTNTLKELYSGAENFPPREDVYFYRHFSMNQFALDLRDRSQEDEKTEDALKRIGAAYRERILG